MFNCALRHRYESSFSLLTPEYYLETIPITVDYGDILGVATLAVVCSTIASVFPAMKASKVDPAVVLARR